jgi:predicted Zn finger-like uncharacterized protein
MSIATNCPHCGAAYNLNEQTRGKTLRCKHCTGTFQVPAGRPAARPAGGAQVQAGRTAPRPPATPPPGRKTAAGNGRTSPAPKKSSAGKIILIVVGILGAGFVLCCGVPSAVFYFGVYSLKSKVESNAQDLQAQMNAEFDKAMKEQQAMMDAAQKGGGGRTPAAGGNDKAPAGGNGKVELPRIVFGKEPANVDEALGMARGNDVGLQGNALNWLARQPVDKGRQKEVARFLESLLSSGNTFVKGPAVHALVTWGDKDTVAPVAKMLDEIKPGPLGGFQTEGMDILARFPDPRGAEAVGRYLPDFFAGETAAKSLTSMGKQAAEPTVLKYYHHPDGGCRERVRRLLQLYGTADSAIVLQSAADLTSKQADTRRLAAEWLGQVRQPDQALREQVAKSLEATLTDSDNGIAERAAQALGAWGGKENVPGLAGVVEDQTAPWNVRRQAIATLARLPDEKGAAAVVKLLNDGGARRDASLALQKMGPAAEKELLKYTNDPTANADGRNEAGRILKAIGSKENVAVGLALTGLKDNDAGRRQQAADALAKMPAVDKDKQADVAAVLVAALNDPDQGVRERAARALVLWAIPDSVDGLVKVVTDDNRWVRVSAMAALGKLQDERGILPIAARLLVPEDRKEASAALQALGPKAEPEVLKGLQTPDKDLLLELLRILKAIGTKASVKPLQYVLQVSLQLKKRDVAEAAAAALQEIGKR